MPLDMGPASTALLSFMGFRTLNCFLCVLLHSSITERNGSAKPYLAQLLLRRNHCCRFEPKNQTGARRMHRSGAAAAFRQSRGLR